VSFPKTKTPRDAKYLAWLRQQRCAWCSAPPPSEVSHHGTHGTGIKASDHGALPLCRHCHAEWHRTTRIRGHEKLTREQTREGLAVHARAYRRAYLRSVDAGG